MNFGASILELQEYKIDIDRLLRTYLISNTPFYLYKHYRNDQFVINLSNKYSATQLIKEFVTRGNNGISSDMDISIEYGIYVALTLKNYKETRSFFENEGRINFEWFDDIKSIYLSSLIPTTHVSLNETSTLNYFTNFNIVQNSHLQNKEYKPDQTLSSS